MNDTTLFTEKQRFPFIYILLFYLLVSAFFFYGIYIQVICGKPFGTKPMPDVGLYMGLAVMTFMALLFLSFKLETEIKQDGIYYRFFPVQMKMRKKSWEDISKCYVRQYKPIWEYGGWGLRLSFRKGWAANISGNKGIQLVMKDGKKILIGTQKMDEVKMILEKLGKYAEE